MNNLHYLVNEAILSATQKKEKNVYDSDDSDPEISKNIKESLFCGILAQNKENEKQAWSLLQTTCSRALNGYPNSLEEDIKILNEDQPLELNQRTCVQMRKIEKDVLQRVME